MINTYLQHVFIDLTHQNNFNFNFFLSYKSYKKIFFMYTVLKLLKNPS